MSRYHRTSFSGIGYPQWTRAVKTIAIACAITWLVQMIAGESFTERFGLRPQDVIDHWRLWQPITYIFLHDPFSPLHILFNVLGLWMFGSELEQTWGTRQFTRFFFICGIGAGLLMVLLSSLTGNGRDAITIGASGSIYGILLAFAMLFPDRIIYWLIFPIPAKYFVMIMGGIAFFSSISASGSSIAHVAHLGGMLCGFVYLKSRGYGRRRGMSIGDKARTWYTRWQRERLRKKFDVYYNDRQGDSRHSRDRQADGRDRQARGPQDDDKWRRWKN